MCDERISFAEPGFLGTSTGLGLHELGARVATASPVPSNGMISSVASSRVRIGALTSR